LTVSETFQWPFHFLLHFSNHLTSDLSFYLFVYVLAHSQVLGVVKGLESHQDLAKAQKDLVTDAQEVVEMMLLA
jgi:hypothetical protein